MRKNLYYRHVIRRRNILGEALLNFFLGIASYPRLLLEVFIRKNFGDRYFSLASAITISALLFSGPWLLPVIGSKYHRSGLWDTITYIPSWYIFTGLFIGFSIVRYREVLYGPSIWDFRKYSLSSGARYSLFRKLLINGKKPSYRMMEIVYEPLAFLLIGILLMMFESPVGYLLIWCSVIYSLSYIAAYKQGDDFIKDKIDEMICNEDLQTMFVDDVQDSDRGFEFRAGRPPGRAQRSALADEFVEYEEVPAEAI